MHCGIEKGVKQMHCGIHFVPFHSHNASNLWYFTIWNVRDISNWAIACHLITAFSMVIQCQWKIDLKCIYTTVPLRELVQNHNSYMREEKMVLGSICCAKCMLGAGILTNHVHNNKCTMHSMQVTAACKTPSHTQSTVSYWLNEVNRSIVFQIFHPGGVTHIPKWYACSSLKMS